MKLIVSLSVCSFSGLISFFPFYSVNHFKLQYLGVGIVLEITELGTLAEVSSTQCFCEHGTRKPLHCSFSKESLEANK